MADSSDSTPCDDVQLPGDGESHGRGAALLWVVLGLIFVRGVFQSADHEPPPADASQIIRTLDPNVAPWWELAVIPRVGPATALAIEHERRAAARGAESASGDVVFHGPGDLDRVRGIGPVTVQWISPYLRFPAEPGDADDAGSDR